LRRGLAGDVERLHVLAAEPPQGELQPSLGRQPGRHDHVRRGRRREGVHPSHRHVHPRDRSRLIRRAKNLWRCAGAHGRGVRPPQRARRPPSRAHRWPNRTITRKEGFPTARLGA
jgi:hypothetical protein